MNEKQETLNEPIEYRFGDITIKDTGKFTKGEMSTSYEIGDGKYLEVLDPARSETMEDREYFLNSAKKDSSEELNDLVVEFEGRLGIIRSDKTVLDERVEEED